MKKQIKTILVTMMTLAMMVGIPMKVFALTPADLAPREPQPILWDHVPQRRQLLADIKDSMLNSFQQEGRIINYCMTIDPEEYSEIQLESFSSDENDEAYEQSDFYTGLIEAKGREFLTILSCKDYDTLFQQYEEDEYKIFAALVSATKQEEEILQLSSNLREEGMPISFHTYLFDGEQYIVHATLNEYIIQKGDTLSDISRRLGRIIGRGVSVKELAELNGIQDPNYIRAEDILIVK